ncbi:MAG TPA: M48 family metalloprotease [Vicinamibacterales bacterium]|jgi:Zn-dependent protease with chaperone function
MVRLLKPVLVVLAIPVLAGVLSLMARTEWEARWDANLVRQVVRQGQRPNGRLIARFSLATLCHDGRTASQIPPCGPYSLFGRIVPVAAIVAGVGLLLLGGIAAAGYACRANPRRLSAVFRPVRLISAWAIVLLILLHTALAVAAWLVIRVVFERWARSSVIVAALGALLAAVAMIWLVIGVSRRSTAVVLGRQLVQSAHPRLMEALRALMPDAVARTPDHVVVGLTPGIFLSEADVVSLDGRLRGRTLYLSLASCRLLSVEEWRSFVSHELAHFDGRDGELAAGFYPLYTGGRRAVDGLRNRVRGLMSIVAWPVLSLVSFVYDAFAAGERQVGRAREFEADRAAAAVTSPATLATALVKLTAFGPAWETALDAMDAAAAAGTQYVNAAELFAEISALNAGSDRLRGQGVLGLAHPTDTHPALVDRLAALGVTLADVARESLDTRPPTSGVSLIDGYVELERALTTAQHRALAGH